MREQRGHTLTHVAVQMGITKAGLSRIETGDLSMSQDTARRLALFYGVTVERLLSSPMDAEPSITVIVAREITSAEKTAEMLGSSTLAKAEGKLWKRVTLPGGALTQKKAEAARTQAFGYMGNAVVAHGWADAFWVPGRRTNRGNTRRKWSAKDTRKLFGNSKEE